MLFDFDQDSTRISARQMVRQSLEAKQRDIYNSHRHRIFSVSFYMTGSEIEAESILQDTFIRAFEKAEEPDGGVIDAALLQEFYRRDLLPEEEAGPVPASPGLAGGGNVLRADLEAAIRRLPCRERLVFLLTDVEGYSAAQTAVLLKISQGTAMRTMMTARMRLRAELAAGQGDGRQAA